MLTLGVIANSRKKRDNTAGDRDPRGRGLQRDDLELPESRDGLPAPDRVGLTWPQSSTHIVLAEQFIESKRWTSKTVNTSTTFDVRR